MSQKNNTSIQDKITRLRELTAWFDGDDFVLEEALAKFKEAEALAAEIEEDLTNLKNEVTIIKQKFDTETA